MCRGRKTPEWVQVAKRPHWESMMGTDWSWMGLLAEKYRGKAAPGRRQALLSKGSEVEACLLCAVSSGRSLCPKPCWESSWRKGKGEGREHHVGPLERPQRNRF